MNQEKRREPAKVILKPAKIGIIDNSFTSYLIKSNVELMPLKSEKNNKVYHLKWAGKGFQLI